MKHLSLICITSFLLFSPVIFADDEQEKGNSFGNTVVDTVLSPAHYAILLGGKLLHPNDKKSDDTAVGPVESTASDAKADTGASPDDDATKVTRKWNHKLPIWGQKVIDMGFDLPNPYGVGAIYTRTKQDISLSQLSIAFSDDPNAPKTEVPFISFETAKTNAKTVEGRVDAWLLPFLNIFAIAGRIEGEAIVPIVIPGEETLKALLPHIGALCDKPAGFPGRPELCDKDIVLIDHSNYTGKNFGVGITLAGGWKNYFAAIPITYTWSDLSNTTNTVTALDASLRVGYSFQPKGTGMLSVYTGTTYLNTKQFVEGVFEYDTGNPIIGEIDIAYEILEQGRKPWNYLAGFNWTLTPNWWVQAEVGFGGARKQFVGSISYRW